MERTIIVPQFGFEQGIRQEAQEAGSQLPPRIGQLHHVEQNSRRYDSGREVRRSSGHSPRGRLGEEAPSILRELRRLERASHRRSRLDGLAANLNDRERHCMNRWRSLPAEDLRRLCDKVGLDSNGSAVLLVARLLQLTHQFEKCPAEP